MGGRTASKAIAVRTISNRRSHITSSRVSHVLISECGKVTKTAKAGDTSVFIHLVNPLNAELNPIYHLLALLGAHHILHVSGVRVKIVQVVETFKSSNTNMAHRDLISLLFQNNFEGGRWVRTTK